MSLECPKCEDNFCCIYFGQTTCSLHCRSQSCFCISCQLYNIEEKSPVVICQKCNFLSQCYGYKYLGKVNRRDCYILQRHCIDHCVLDSCPHRDEATVGLGRLRPPPNYNHLILIGSPLAIIDIYHQSAGTQRIEDRDTLIPSGKGYPIMLLRLPKKNRSRLKGILATQKLRRARTGAEWSRRGGNDR
jgi:hypothetical protein